MRRLRALGLSEATERAKAVAHPGAANATISARARADGAERSVAHAPYAAAFKQVVIAGQAAEIDRQLCRCAVCNAESTEVRRDDAEIVVDTDDTASAVAAERAVCDSQR